MNIEKNRIDLFQQVLIKERFNKKSKQKFKAYNKDYSSFMNEFFDKEINTDALFNFLVGKKVYTKTKTDFYKTFACDLDWAKQLSYCPKPKTNKEIFGSSEDPTITGGGVQTTYGNPSELP